MIGIHLIGIFVIYNYLTPMFTIFCLWCLCMKSKQTGIFIGNVLWWLVTFSLQWGDSTRLFLGRIVEESMIFFVRGHSCELNFLMTIMGCHIVHLISFQFSFHNIENDLMVQEATWVWSNSQKLFSLINNESEEKTGMGVARIVKGEGRQMFWFVGGAPHPSITKSLWYYWIHLIVFD